MSAWHRTPGITQMQFHVCASRISHARLSFAPKQICIRCARAKSASREARIGAPVSLSFMQSPSACRTCKHYSGPPQCRASVDAVLATCSGPRARARSRGSARPQLTAVHERGGAAPCFDASAARLLTRACPRQPEGRAGPFSPHSTLTPACHALRASAHSCRCKSPCTLIPAYPARLRTARGLHAGAQPPLPGRARPSQAGQVRGRAP